MVGTPESSEIQWFVIIRGYSPFPDTHMEKNRLNDLAMAQGRPFQLQRGHQRLWQRERLGESTGAVSGDARAGCDQLLEREGVKMTLTTLMISPFTKCLIP